MRADKYKTCVERSEKYVPTRGRTYSDVLISNYVKLKIMITNCKNVASERYPSTTFSTSTDS